ncbi:hypothetical protein YQE_09514, partial [Dendroctonus ponderosae]
MVTNWTPMETFTSFQFTLNNLDLSGAKNSPIKLQDLRRFRGLRTLTLSRLIQPHIASEDFLEYGVDLEELSITYANLQSIKSNAFKYVHGLKHIDLSDNNIGTIENNAFKDIGYSLEQLHLAHAFSSSVTSIPGDGIKVLNNLEYLDLSNNKFRIMEENSFHFLGKLRKLELQDNIIETIHKGTFQVDMNVY